MAARKSEGTDAREPSLMHNIGAFFGHIREAIHEKVSDDASEKASEKANEKPTEKPSEKSREQAAERVEVRRDVQEARVGEYILRRTTIDEVQRADGPAPAAEPTSGQTEANENRENHDASH